MNAGMSEGNTPTIESLFEAERDIAPSPEEIRRRAIRRAQAAVFHGIPARVAVDGGSSRGRLIGKAAAAIVVFVGLTAVAYELGYRRSRENPGTVVPKAATLPAPISETMPEPVPAEMAAVIDSLSEPLSAPPRRPTKPRAVSAPVATPGGDVYALELRLLRPAQMAVGRLSFANALALVDEHQRRFPSGHLAEEREALRVKALLGLDRRVEARKVAADFRARFPNSALLARIQAMLGTER
jgi:hypothetical protein